MIAIMLLTVIETMLWTVVIVALVRLCEERKEEIKRVFIGGVLVGILMTVQVITTITKVSDMVKKEEKVTIKSVGHKDNKIKYNKGLEGWMCSDNAGILH